MVGKKLYIFGDSGFSKLVAHYFSKSDSHNVSGFLVDEEYLGGRDFIGEYPLESLEKFVLGSEKNVEIFVSIGYREMRARKRIFDRIKSFGLQMPNKICKGALVDETVTLGVNNIIMPGAVIEPNVEIGNNNVVWSNVTICHDTQVGDHNFFAANSTVGGGCKLGDLCFFGFSSTVVQERAIANETLVAAMALVREDTTTSSCYQGVPAKLAGSHEGLGIEIK